MGSNQRKRVKIDDVAQYLGVSPSTVSRAFASHSGVRINSDTRKRVLTAASRLGYYPNLMAQAVARRKTGVLGLLGNAIVDPFNASVVQGIMLEARRHGYQVLTELRTSPYLSDPMDDLRLQQIRRMIAWGVDGLLIHMRGGTRESRLIRDTVGKDMPVVVFSHSLEGISSVVLDRTAGVYMATEHLIHLGYRRIAFVELRPLFQTEKEQGYLQAMQSYNLTPEQIYGEEYTLEAFYRLGSQIGRMSDRPEALVCQGDMMAYGICGGLRAVGLYVPEDMAVVGFDNSEFGAYSVIPLTTVDQPLAEICQNAVQLLIDQIDGETKVKQVTVQPRLIVRRSCGAESRKNAIESSGDTIV